jgi:hypothetical protein
MNKVKIIGSINMPSCKLSNQALIAVLVMCVRLRVRVRVRIQDEL